MRQRRSRPYQPLANVRTRRLLDDDDVPLVGAGWGQCMAGGDVERKLGLTWRGNKDRQPGGAVAGRADYDMRLGRKRGSKMDRADGGA